MMDKKFKVEYWPLYIETEIETIEVPSREEAESKQTELAEEGYASVIREIRV